MSPKNCPGLGDPQTWGDVMDRRDPRYIEDDTDLAGDCEALQDELAAYVDEHAKAYALWQRLLPLLPASLTQCPRTGQIVGALTDTLECIAAPDCKLVGDKLLAEVGL